MTIHIPEWLLWVLAGVVGIPALLLLGVFASIGFAFWRGF